MCLTVSKVLTARSLIWPWTSAGSLDTTSMIFTEEHWPTRKKRLQGQNVYSAALTNDYVLDAMHWQHLNLGFRRPTLSRVC